MKRLTIGRAPDCDWPVDDDYVSKVHAVIEERPDGSLWVVDQGTLNGTWLNESRVWLEARIYSGDTIRVGRTKLTVP